MPGTSAILYDPEDEAIYMSRKWYINDMGYAVWRGVIDGKKQTIRLHRLVNNTPEGMSTDHKNGNKLDNRRSNLRTVTQKENAQNIHSAKGYFWNTGKGKWQVNHKGKFYGTYDTESKAIEGLKKARSGVLKTSSVHPRRRFLPRGVFFMQPSVQRGTSPYYIRPQRNGIKYFQGYFSTVQEAEQAYSNFLVQGGLTS